jgi:hypothetical protein
MKAKTVVWIPEEKQEDVTWKPLVFYARLVDADARMACAELSRNNPEAEYRATAYAPMEMPE